MAYDVEKVLSKMSQTKKKAAEMVKENTLGKHVALILKRDGDISLSTLLQSLQDQVDNSDSAKGRCNQDQDLDRFAAEAVLSYIATLVKTAD